MNDSISKVEYSMYEVFVFNCTRLIIFSSFLQRILQFKFILLQKMRIFIKFTEFKLTNINNTLQPAL